MVPLTFNDGMVGLNLDSPAMTHITVPIAFVSPASRPTIRTSAVLSAVEPLTFVSLLVGPHLLTLPMTLVCFPTALVVFATNPRVDTVAAHLSLDPVSDVLLAIRPTLRALSMFDTTAPLSVVDFHLIPIRFSHFAGAMFLIVQPLTYIFLAIFSVLFSLSLPHVV